MKRCHLIVFGFVMLDLLIGCNRSARKTPVPGDSSSAVSAEDAATEAVFAAIEGPMFEDLPPRETGVDFVHRLDGDHRLAYLYHSGYSCGGVCLGDVNGDGLTDIFLASGPDQNALYLNQGNLKFARLDAFENAESTWSVGASMTDIDGDGDLDLYVCNYESSNTLWLNQGDDGQGGMRFTEAAQASGLDFVGPSHCPYFADFDRDGDLDLFLLTNRVYSPAGRPNVVASELGPNGKPRIKDQFARHFRVVRPKAEAPSSDPSARTPPPFMLELGHEDRLYRNDGINQAGAVNFSDVTSSSGLKDAFGHGLSALVWDANSDGLPDIYVANDYSDPDAFWINQGPDSDGNFRFKDETEQRVPYTAWSSMGSDIGDVDGDGKLDFMVADMAATTHFKAKSTMGEMSGWRRWVLENDWPRQAMRNMLYVDSGVGRYKEAAFLAGVGSSDWTWSVKFADFDLDGRNDLFLTNGTARVFSDSDVAIKPGMLVGQTEWTIFRDKPQNRELNAAFQNVGQGPGDFAFHNVGKSWGLSKESMSYGAATGDLDNDGDLDLVVCNLDEPVSIYRNRATESGSHWLRVKLDGSEGNKLGVGAVVTATLPSGRKIVRPMNPQTGFLSVNDSVLHFGLGRNDRVSRLDIHWPDGTRQQLGEQPADNLVVAKKEPTPTNPATPTGQTPTDGGEPLFAEASTRELGLRFRHKEHPFNDYEREFLLPGKLSQLGPGIAVADVNGDHLDDIFIGGGASQSGALFLHQPDHVFAHVPDMPWTTDASSEDMGLLFFDADRDGDLDLYVAHGSNQWTAEHPRYADQLYLNQTLTGGEIQFTRNDGSLPAGNNSSSCVAGADFDHDGDVDLFIGSRSVPGQYPETPNSRFLRNDSSRAGEVKFTDVTDSVAPGLRKCGLVTSALWSDADSDGWADLLVTTEWGPVRLFLNRSGTLEEVTKSLEFAEHTGWWNSIVGADFDADGDIDYATMNVGLNTKYGQATVKKPAILYRGDMDRNGTYDLVEAKSALDGELPVRGRSCSCNAMPLLRKKFPTFKQFALSSLEGIYTDTGLDNATRVAATEFRSGIWINNSSPDRPSFHWQPLPTDAQLSPCFGTVAANFSGQNLATLVAAQNHYSREPETGLWRGGLGHVSSWTTNSAFETTTTDRSGFVVAGDGKGLAVADLNGDGRPDLLAAQNDSYLKVFLANGTSRQTAVRLQGLPGNPTALGAKVSLTSGGQTLAATEISGGSGYLSQSTSCVFFSVPTAPERDAVIRVVWPDGSESQKTITSAPGDMILIRQSVSP